MTRLAAILCALGIILAGCGAESAGGPVKLDWFIFNEPSGAPVRIAERCSQESGGRYDIEFRYLPSSADAQREQLVRRLAAEDDTIDLIGMDIIWTGEFANAGWIREVPGAIEQDLTGTVFDSVLASARFEDRLYAVPIWSNTQLLWYTLVAFFREIPWDLEQAAQVDGATPFQAFRRVIVPLAAPGVFTAATLVFIFCWNDFVFAISLTSSDASRTVPAALAFFTGESQFTQPTGSIAAAAVVVTIPIVIMVLVFQRRIVSGLTAGAVKG